MRLSWHDPENAELSYSYTANIITKDNNDLFVTAPPLARDYPIQRRTEVSVYILTEGNDVEEYSTIYNGVEDELSLFPMWALRYPMYRVSVKRINKRGHFRLDIQAPFYYARLKEELFIPTRHPYQGETINISGGGMRGLVPFRLEMGELLEVVLHVEPYRLFLRSELVMQRPLRIPGKYVDEVALRFVAHGGEDFEEQLVRYVTREQINRTALTD